MSFKQDSSLGNQNHSRKKNTRSIVNKANPHDRRSIHIKKSHSKNCSQDASENLNLSAVFLPKVKVVVLDFTDSTNKLVYN